jgi:integrase
MPKERSGYVYRETVIYATVTGRLNGARHTAKRRADSQAHALKLIETLSKDFNSVDSTSVVTDKGNWIARASYTDESGTRRTIKRAGESKTEAREALKAALKEYEDLGGTLSANVTFAELADYFEKTYVKEPDYVDGRKVAGMRSWKTVKYRVRELRDYFGKKKLKSILHSHIEAYKHDALKRKTVRKKSRSLADVNRQLAILRRMFNVALRQNWIVRNPFESGDSLIRPGDERGRERVLTREEEEKLLSHCTGGKRKHMRAIIIALVDTGLRKGELLSLKFNDVSLADRTITVQSFNTKTQRERQVPISDRLAVEIEALYERSGKNPDGLVFGVGDFKKAFVSIVEDAELADLKPHDLRHTFGSRLTSEGLALPEVARLLGHSQLSTSYRYINSSDDTRQKAIKILNKINNAEPNKEGKKRRGKNRATKRQIR